MPTKLPHTKQVEIYTVNGSQPKYAPNLITNHLCQLTPCIHIICMHTLCLHEYTLQESNIVQLGTEQRAVARLITNWQHTLYYHKDIL